MKKRIMAALMVGMVCIVNSFGVFAADQTLVGISGEVIGNESGTAGSTEAELDAGITNPIREYVAQMSREEKVGQMMLLSPSQLCSGGNWTENMDTVIQNMKNYYVGGLIFFAEDLANPEAVKTLIGKVNEQGKIPVLTVSDESGSLEAGFTKPEEDTNMNIGPLSIGTDGIWCYSTQQTPAEEWKAMGILLDVTPGMSPETEADFAIVTHAKVTYSTVQESNGPVSTAADDGRPASMARSLVTGTLRSAFQGVVMTDSLSMPEATENYGGNMAVMNALQAGADILTAPFDVMTAYYGIHSAIDEEMVTEEQINASVIRILEAKAKLGLDF